ncbi:MAG: hypothetical protein LBS99_06925 [Clostridiales bacterium]|jgi:hypothetical protein|nr:hypothetical protein [Clostridiales bacterium]
MKDERIDELLTDYVERIKPPTAWAVSRAMREVAEAPARLAAQERRRRRAGRIFALAASSAAAVTAFIFMLSFVLNNIIAPSDDSDAPSQSYYRLSALNTVSADYAAAAAAANGKLPVLGSAALDDENVRTLYTVYSRPGAAGAAVVSVRYRLITEAGTDELVIYADLEGGLEDYLSLKNEPEFFSGAFGYERYLDGEYYTSLYLAHDGVSCYMLVMSAASGRGVEYLEALLV